MPEYDIVVVGAGPAGSTVAKTCAEEGLKVVLIEKHPESGFKLCSGYLPFRIVKEFDIDRSLVECNINWAHLVGKKHSAMKPIKGDVTVDRSRLDRYLAERAIDCGANILTSTTCRGVTREKNGRISGIVANSPKGLIKIRGKIVVAADGFNSSTARSADLLPRYRSSDVALTVQVEIYTKEEVDEDVTYCFYDDNIAMCGYGWIIPKKYGYSVGVGCLLSHLRGRLERNLRYLIEKHPIANEILSKAVRKSNLRAACIPLRQSPEICDAGIMVVGDAAGHADPLGGYGGIYSAMTAGQLASKVATAAISNEDASRESLLEYQNSWKSNHGEMLKQKKDILEKNKDNFIKYIDSTIFLEKHPLLKKMYTFRNDVFWRLSNFRK